MDHYKTMWSIQWKTASTVMTPVHGGKVQSILHRTTCNPSHHDLVTCLGHPSFTSGEVDIQCTLPRSSINRIAIIVQHTHTFKHNDSLPQGPARTSYVSDPQVHFTLALSYLYLVRNVYSECVYFFFLVDVDLYNLFSIKSFRTMSAFSTSFVNRMKRVE